MLIFIKKNKTNKMSHSLNTDETALYGYFFYTVLCFYRFVKVMNRMKTNSPSLAFQFLGEIIHLYDIASMLQRQSAFADRKLPHSVRTRR